MSVAQKPFFRWLLIFLLIVVVLWLSWSVIGQHHWIPDNVFVSKLPGPTHLGGQSSSILKPLEPSHFSNQSDVKCINATVDNLRFPICIYERKNDIYVSEAVARGGYFEIELVSKFLNFMRHHPDVTFVDLGANIGTYTLPLAHSGIPVVAVEPSNDTLRRLAKSIYMGKVEQTVRLFKCAISNETLTMYLKPDPSNTALNFLAGKEPCAGCSSTEVTTLNNFIPLLHNKKVLMKVDTETTEILIFQPHSAGKFFESNDVLMIQIEFMHYIWNFNAKKIDRPSVDRFLGFFYERGYDVYDPRSEKKLDSDWLKWSFDVIFKKKSLPTDKLFYL